MKKYSKRLLTLLITMSMLLSTVVLFATTAVASGGDAPWQLSMPTTVNATVTSDTQGPIFEIPVSVANNNGLHAIVIDVEFAAPLMWQAPSVGTVQWCDDCRADATPMGIAATGSGQTRMIDMNKSHDCLNNITDDGVLFNLRFRLPANTPEGTAAVSVTVRNIGVYPPNSDNPMDMFKSYDSSGTTNTFTPTVATTTVNIAETPEPIEKIGFTIAAPVVDATPAELVGALTPVGVTAGAITWTPAPKEDAGRKYFSAKETYTATVTVNATATSDLIDDTTVIEVNGTAVAAANITIAANEKSAEVKVTFPATAECCADCKCAPGAEKDCAVCEGTGKVVAGETWVNLGATNLIGGWAEGQPGWDVSSDPLLTQVKNATQWEIVLTSPGSGHFNNDGIGGLDVALRYGEPDVDGDREWTQTNILAGDWTNTNVIVTQLMEHAAVDLATLVEGVLTITLDITKLNGYAGFVAEPEGLFLSMNNVVPQGYLTSSRIAYDSTDEVDCTAPGCDKGKVAGEMIHTSACKDTGKDCICEKCNPLIPPGKCDHDWGEWKVVKEATTTEEGLEERECKLCKETEERKIPKKTPVNPDPGPRPGPVNPTDPTTPSDPSGPTGPSVPGTGKNLGEFGSLEELMAAATDAEKGDYAFVGNEIYIFDGTNWVLENEFVPGPGPSDFSGSKLGDFKTMAELEAAGLKPAVGDYVTINGVAYSWNGNAWVDADGKVYDANPDTAVTLSIAGAILAAGAASGTALRRRKRK